MEARSGPKIGDVKTGVGSAVRRPDGGRLHACSFASGSTTYPRTELTASSRRTVRLATGQGSSPAAADLPEAYAELDATLQPLAAGGKLLAEGQAETG
jgi:hypothetical protein